LSQYFILHTRESPTRFLTYQEYIIEVINGCQRDGIAKHMMWATRGRPGGHKGPLHWLTSYAQSLEVSKQSDILVSLASV